jgi:hypothetical protein
MPVPKTVRADLAGFALHRDPQKTADFCNVTDAPQAARKIQTKIQTN